VRQAGPSAVAHRAASYEAPLVRRLGHVPALDGLRGIAILVVLLYHGYGLPGGFLGVDLFFVLSGFLITALLLDEHERYRTISLRSFYLRRARRLLPVAIAAIAFYTTMVIAFYTTTRTGGAIAAGMDVRRQLLGALLATFYLENLAHFLHPPVVDGIGHFWSLSQEEQFYFVWPPLLALLVRRRIRARWVAGGLAVALVAIVVHRGMLAGGDWLRFYYAPDARADGMLLGCLMAFAFKMGKLRPGRAWLLVGPAAVSLYAFDVAVLHPASPATALHGISVANIAAGGMICSIVMAPRAPLSRLLGIGPLRTLGLISYGLYIWQPIVASSTGASGTLMLVLAVAVASLSYRFIERPFRRRRSSGVEPGPELTAAPPARVQGDASIASAL
jgi:peptidoglycan/LPS O-acetylase OafA/YrhL